MIGLSQDVEHGPRLSVTRPRDPQPTCCQTVRQHFSTSRTTVFKSFYLSHKCSLGIVSRTLVFNKSTGLLCTTSIAVLRPFAEKLNDANLAPETLFTVNSVPVVVGGEFTLKILIQ